MKTKKLSLEEKTFIKDLSEEALKKVWEENEKIRYIFDRKTDFSLNQKDLLPSFLKSMKDGLECFDKVYIIDNFSAYEDITIRVSYECSGDTDDDWC